MPSNTDSLLTVLNTTNLQKNDSRLYQVISSLVQNLLKAEQLLGVASTQQTSGFVTTSGLSGTNQLVRSTGPRNIEDTNLTGDVTTANNSVATLANTAVTPATYGDATHVGQFTVDSKGRLTFAANVLITNSGVSFAHQFLMGA